MPRSYQKKGGHGGRRPGAGKPPGSSSPLDYGELRALKSCGLRVPKDAPPEVAKLAEESLGRLIDVMMCGVHFSEAGNVLKAATRLREEACGPLAQKLEHSGPGGAPLAVNINIDLGEEDDASSSDT